MDHIPDDTSRLMDPSRLEGRFSHSRSLLSSVFRHPHRATTSKILSRLDTSTGGETSMVSGEDMHS